MTAFYGVTSSEISEAGRLLECAVRSLAEKRATSEDLATIGDEIVGMYASLDDPVQFAIHDKRFHQAVADAAGNRILTSLLNMVSAVLLEARSNNGIRGNDLHEAAQLSREIYQAIRKHSSVEAIDTTKLAY
jgi:GntR family transcriptional repressor for pyruvate dehydrogenase complex